MTDPITGATGTTSTSGTTTTGGTRSGNEIDKDMFLKLLVAQLRYQDPSNPADNSEFLAQTAQFTMVEKLEDLASSQQQSLSAQLMFGASALIGRTVNYLDGDGNETTGVVKSATFSGSTPTLRVGDTDVPLSSVREVHTTAG